MSAARVLAMLYPPAVRELWGADIRCEVRASGFRSWPDTVLGAGRLWLHPRHWPEVSPGQTRRVVTVALAAVTAAAALLLRTVSPSPALTADAGHPVTSVWVLPLVLGVLLAAPRPAAGLAALRTLAVLAVRTMAAPAAVGLALALTAWSGAARAATGYADAALVLAYWLALGFAALRACTLVARVSRLTGPPTVRRLSAALLCVGTGLALAAGQRLLPLAAAGCHPAFAAQALALGLLAAATVGAGRDLRRQRS